MSLGSPFELFIPKFSAFKNVSSTLKSDKDSVRLSYDSVVVVTSFYPAYACLVSKILRASE